MFSNKKGNALRLVICIMLVLSLLCGCAENEYKSSGKIVPYSVDSAELNSNRYTSAEPEALKAQPLSLEGYDLLLENENLGLYYNKSVAALRLLDKSNGYVWGSLEKEKPENLNKKWTKYANSIVAVEVADKDGSVSTVGASKQELSFEKSENSLKFKAFFTDYNLSFNFELSLTDDGIKFKVDEKSVKEGKNSRLVSITFIPYFGSVEGNKNAGYMFIPDGCGALIRYNDSRNYLEGFKKRIYGYDYGIDSLETINDAGASRINTFAADEQQVFLPVFGMTHGVKQNAFYAIVENGDEYATINVDPAGIITDYNRVNVSFIYRSNYEQPVNRKSAGVKTVQKESNKLSPVISYHFLSGTDADYVGMAKGYRSFLLSKNEIEKISAKGKTPLRLDILVSDVQKEFIGSSVNRITGYEQTEKLVKSLNGLKINNINLSLLGWQKSGYNGYNILNNSFNSIYSKSDLESLDKILTKNGGKLLLHTAVFKGSKLQLDIKTKSAITMSQNIAEISGDEDEFYLSDKFLAKPKLFADSLNEKIKNSDYGLLLDDIGSMLYGEYLENDVTSRGDTKQLICDTFGKSGKKDFYFVSPNSYLLKYAKAFYNSPIVNSQFVFETDCVPFLQIALSGYIEMYSPYVNCNLYSKSDLLKMIDYNVYPSFILSGKDNYGLRNTATAFIQSSKISDWQEYIADSYRLIDDVLKNTYGQPVINRSVISVGFVRVDYQNGSVYVNYNNTDVSSGELSVGAETAIFVSGGESNVQ